MPTASADLLDFLDRSPSPYHAVAEVRQRLLEAGYEAWSLADAWNERQRQPGSRGFVAHGGTIVAMHVGDRPVHETGMRLVGAHTDSPNLRIKPNPNLHSSGVEQLGVEPYGGVLLHTWLDRDLGIAGRAIGHNGHEHLVNIDAPVLRVPSLAIHLSRSVNTEGLVLNAQKHLAPMMALSAEGAFHLRDLIAPALLGIDAKSIVAWDLMLYDVTPATLGGAREEFIFSARIDNLASCHAALCALLNEPDTTELTRGFVFYDHEEVGSRSAIGAGSVFLRNVLERLAGSHESLARAAAQSWFASVDMAHAEHPNYADKHEPRHSPKLGAGPVIKINNNQSYATDARGWALIERCAEEAEVEVQKFVVRSDMGCGSTVGPITAANLAMATVDLGNPMLSMHSCREVAASADVPDMIALLERFYSTANGS